jgi:6-pyruvoyltetrahydropterin/6-carboxytetrahydropterin synthase
MAYSIGASGMFEAALSLPGLGSAERLHGHTYKVEAELFGDELDERGVLVDLAELKRSLYECLKFLHFQHLNQLPEFKDIPPTAENIARLVWRKLKENNAFSKFRLRVKVWENDFLWATYEE